MKNGNWRMNGVMAGRILVIEDNPTNLELTTYLLKAFNYTVLTAADGSQAINIAGRERVDLIICDIHLPGWMAMK
jgi:CheY-like chemotaxis protein